MSSITPNMGLVKWTELSDPYDHSQLSGNFQKLDEHDHTSGKGVQIPTGGIKDEAVTTAKLADSSVTGAKLVAGAVSADKIGSGIVASLGDLKWWWRPNTNTAIPAAGWVVAAGQTLLAAAHEFPGGGSIVLPNLIERFPLGVEVANIGTGGGSSSVNLAHTHTVTNHSHGVAAHTHFINLESGLGAATELKISQDLEGHAWVHADDNPNGQHRHSINGSVGSTGLVTEGASPGTSSSLGSQSIMPPWVGLLPLIKVKNS